MAQLAIGGHEAAANQTMNQPRTTPWFYESHRYYCARWLLP